MTPTLALLVFAGGGAGAASRYATDRFVQARLGPDFPWGTFTVNVVGCALLGILGALGLRYGWAAEPTALLGTGFCGGLTTFSTFCVENVNLFHRRRRMAMLGNIVLSCAVGITAAALAYRLL